MGWEHDARARSALDRLLTATEFERAPRQAEALRIMVEATISGKCLSGRSLAGAIYGRDTVEFVRAAQQLAREIRLKLPRIYERDGAGPILFCLREGSYAVEIVDSVRSTRRTSETDDEDEHRDAGGSRDDDRGTEMPRSRLCPA